MVALQFVFPRKYQLCEDAILAGVNASEVKRNSRGNVFPPTGLLSVFGKL